MITIVSNGVREFVRNGLWPVPRTKAQKALYAFLFVTVCIPVGFAMFSFTSAAKLVGWRPK